MSSHEVFEGSFGRWSCTVPINPSDVVTILSIAVERPDVGDGVAA